MSACTCVREWVANIFFYRKSDTAIMIPMPGTTTIPAGRKNGLAGHRPAVHRHILMHSSGHRPRGRGGERTAQFCSGAQKLYIGEIENRYLTGEVRRKVIYHLYNCRRSQLTTKGAAAGSGRLSRLTASKLVFSRSRHTWGHMVYLDDKYLFTTATLWFGADSGF